jgi:hypothetical protein
MLPEIRPELVQAVQQEIRRGVAHNHLVDSALRGRNMQREIRILARLGVWLVERGRAIEARYTIEPTPMRELR